MKKLLLLALLLAGIASVEAQFVTVRNHQFILNGQPYYYIGTNYWYGSLLPLEKDLDRGINRLRRELDQLKALGVTNLRVLAGAEGEGLVQGVERVGPALQPEKGKFNEGVLKGLDVLLVEMKKRNMKAIVFFSNNWEWSGGFIQYLRWNNVISEETFRKKLDWDELRDVVSKFYSCAPCLEDYNKHMNVVLNHTNHLTGKKYTEDATIMAWELANEPRPMRPAANEAYAKWIADVSAAIKKKAPKQMVTLGHEGTIGTADDALYERIHLDKNVDYLTIHIWPKNWGWFTHTDSTEQVKNAYKLSAEYVEKHVQLARKLKKPLVIEEFGWNRDGMVFSHKAATATRDEYYRQIFSEWFKHKQTGDVIAGANFWAYGGDARPIPGQDFKKKGDEWMGDPPMEQQGLYSVFSSDSSTLKLIRSFTRPVTAQR